MRVRALRAVGVLLVMLAAFGFCAKGAYADGGSFSDEIIYGPDIYNVRAGTWCIQTYSASSFNAALTALGYDPYDCRFTTEVRSYLSDSSQGGSFYEFASAFSNNNDPSHGVTIYSVNYSTALDLNNAIYGAEYVYGASYTEELFNGAKRRVEEVLAGDIGDGGGGDVPSGDVPSTLDMVFLSSVTNQNLEFVQQDLVYHVTLSEQFRTAIEPYLEDYPYCTAFMPKYFYPDGSNIANNLNVYVVLSEVAPQISQIDVSFGKAIYAIGRGITGTRSGNDIALQFTNTSFSTSNSYIQPINVSNSGNSYYLSSLGSSTPTVPPNNWPDDNTPVVPNPPELPTPTDPTLPTQPTDPTGPSDPTYISQPTYVTNIFTADLQGILDALDEHCQHLQDALYANIKDLNDNLTIKLGNEFSKLRTLIRQQIDWAVESIAECFETLTDNIYDLFHWLADQMDFNFSVEPYNDNSVLYWLRRIYSKLGGGVNTKPVDPVADPFDFWEWLYQLWQNFVIDLIALGADGLGEIAYMLGELIHKFPFSIPWDIAAMLALFVAEPVIPVIQWPMFYYTGSSVATTTVNIDLSPYDSYVEPVRIMIKIAFAFALAWRTKDMLELLTIARGGND